MTPLEVESINDRRTTPMTDVNTLIRLIDQELAADVGREKAEWAERARAARERGPRIQRYEAGAQHVIELVRPRLAAFIERFKDVVKAEPSVAPRKSSRWWSAMTSSRSWIFPSTRCRTTRWSSGSTNGSWPS
jgi:hypothetical protein